MLFLDSISFRWATLNHLKQIAGLGGQSLFAAIEGQCVVGQAQPNDLDLRRAYVHYSHNFSRNLAQLRLFDKNRVRLETGYFFQRGRVIGGRANPLDAGMPQELTHRVEKERVNP